MSTDDTLGPFKTGEHPDGTAYGACSLEDRREIVKRFSYPQCKAAMRVSGLQLGVIHALERRMKQLRREGNAPAGDMETLIRHQETTRG